MSRKIYIDPALATPQLFKLKLRNEALGPFNFQVMRGGRELHFQGPEQLTIQDQGVVIALSQLFGDAIAGMDAQLTLERQAKEDQRKLERRAVYQKLVEKLEHKGVSTLEGLKAANEEWFARVEKHPTWVVIETTFNKLASIANNFQHPSGVALANVEKSLNKLAAVVMRESSDTAQVTSRFLSWTTSLEADKRGLSVLLNWRCARAMKGSGYFKIDNAEREELCGELARALHFQLSAMMNSRRFMTFKPDTLLAKIYPTAKTEDAQRRRRKRLTPALTELSTLQSWWLRDIEGPIIGIGHRSSPRQGEAGPPAQRSQRGSML